MDRVDEILYLYEDVEGFADGGSAGQLVRNTVDGSRPGYGGPGSGAKKGSIPKLTSAEKRATRYKKILENLPEGYFDEYVKNFYNVDKKTEKLTHVGGGLNPEKGIPYMEKKYGNILKETLPSMPKLKIKDVNAAIIKSIEDQIESGLNAGRKIRKADLEAIGSWYPKAPKGMVTHHFLPKVAMEGTDLNYASSRNTAFISRELNSKMSPYDTKLKANQKEQIKLLNEKLPEWEKKIEDLNIKSRALVKNAAREIPGSAGYLGFSEMKITSEGKPIFETRGIDYNKSLSGINKADAVIYKNISDADKIIVNKMSNIKKQQNIKGANQAGFVSKELLEDTAKGLGKGAKTIGSVARKLGAGYELGFIGLDFINNLDSMDANTAFQTALENATLGVYEGGKRAQWEDFETAGKELGHNPENLNEIKSMLDLEKMLAGEKEVLNKMIAYNQTDPKTHFPEEEIKWRKDVVARLEKEFKNKQNTFWSKDNAEDLAKNYQDTVGYIARKEYNKNLNREGAGKMFFGDKERRVNPDMNVIGSPLWQVITDWKDYVPQSILPQNFLQNYLTKAIPNTLRKLPGVLGDVWEPTSERAKLYDRSDEEIKQRAKDLNIQEQYYHPVTGNTMTDQQMGSYYDRYYAGGGIAGIRRRGAIPPESGPQPQGLENLKYYVTNT